MPFSCNLSLKISFSSFIIKEIPIFSEDMQLKQDMIAVMDLGSTRNTDVARAVRALGVYSEIVNYDVTAEELR